MKDKTKGKILQIIDNADNFSAMLINAIYFEGALENEFSTYLTKPDVFTNADGTKTQTDFMNKTSWIPYAETKSAKIIELPYKNRVVKFSDSGEHIDTDSFDDIDVSMYLMLADSGINAERLVAAEYGNEPLFLFMCVLTLSLYNLNASLQLIIPFLYAMCYNK